MPSDQANLSRLKKDGEAATFGVLLRKYQLISILVAATLVTILLSALLFQIAGADPFSAFYTMVLGAFGSKFAISQTITRTIPLLIIALGLIMVFRANLWNIGAEGQFLVGALAGGVVAIEFPVSSGWLAIPCAFIAATIAGGLWAGLAGWFKAKWEVHEVITTLLMNFLAVILFSYLIRGPLRDPMGFLPESKLVPDFAQLPQVPGLATNIGILLALALSCLFAYILAFTRYGLKIRMIGGSPSVSKAMGVDPARMTVQLMMISGGLAGLAGVVHVLGAQYALIEGLSPGFGFTAILVVLLGRLNPFGVVIAAVVLSAISTGGSAIQVSHGVPTAVVATISALFVVCLLVVERVTQKSRH